MVNTSNTGYDTLRCHSGLIFVPNMLLGQHLSRRWGSKGSLFTVRGDGIKKLDVHGLDTDSSIFPEKILPHGR